MALELLIEKRNRILGMRLLLCSLIYLPLMVSAQVSYLRADSVKVCRLLEEAPRQASTLWFARQFMGVPYVAHTLEINDEEQLVVNTRQLDCTTLVETVTALTVCHQQGLTTWADYLSILRQLRYRGGVMDGYPTRLHYFSDWIDDKVQMEIVKDIQSPNPPFTAVQTLNINYMSQHPQSYKALTAHPSLVPLIRQQEQALSLYSQVGCQEYTSVAPDCQGR